MSTKNQNNSQDLVTANKELRGFFKELSNSIGKIQKKQAEAIILAIANNVEKGLKDGKTDQEIIEHHSNFHKNNPSLNKKIIEITEEIISNKRNNNNSKNSNFLSKIVSKFINFCNSAINPLQHKTGIINKELKLKTQAIAQELLTKKQPTNSNRNIVNAINNKSFQDSKKRGNKL